MLKPCTLLLVLFSLAVRLHAQRTAVAGYLADSLTHLPIAGGTIQNFTAGKSVRTDYSGFFRLEAGPGDLIFAIAPHYRHDTLRYSLLFRDTITVFLAPSAQMLENVTVSGYSQYQMDSLARRKEFDEAKGLTHSTIAKNRGEGFGLVINMDRLFKKKYRDKARAGRAFSRMEQEAYINARFSPQLVSFYTGLKGDALLEFMRRYRPEYEWLRQHPSREQLIDYISERLKEYRKPL